MEELKALIEELTQRIVALEAENAAVKGEVRATRLKEYKQVRRELSQALEKADALEEKFWNTWDDILKDELTQTLLQVMSPTGNKLGFKFTDVITDVVAQTITAKADFRDEAKNKDRWGKIVGKIVKNDLVAAVLNSNPITATVSAVVGAAADFFETKIETIKESRGAFQSTAEVINVFEDEHIQAFVDRMKPYVSFYDTLTQISIQYETDLGYMKEKASTLRELMTDYDANLLKALEFNTRDTRFEQLSELLDVKNHDEEDFDFDLILNNKRVVDGLAHVEGFSHMEQEVALFKTRYNSRYRQFLIDYRDCLKKNFGPGSSIGEGFNQDAVRKVIDQIDGVIQNLEQGVASRSLLDRPVAFFPG